MSIGSFFDFTWNTPMEEASQEEGWARGLLTTEVPSEVARRMIQRAPDKPHIELVRNVYPAAALGGKQEKPLSERQKRAYDATLDVLGDYRKKMKEDEIPNKIEIVASRLKQSPEIIKTTILTCFPEDGEVSALPLFLENMQAKLCNLSPGENENYYAALHLILDQHLEKDITIEILKHYGKDSRFLSEDKSYHLIDKAIRHDLQEVFSLLVENIHTPDLLQAMMYPLRASSFYIHSDDLRILLDKCVANIGFYIGYWVDTFIRKFECNHNDLNYHLLAQLIVLSEHPSDRFHYFIKKLCDNKDFKFAQDLIDLVGNETKKTKIRLGILPAACEQLSYVVGYAKYNMLSYSKMEFPGCSEAEIKAVITQDSFGIFKEKLSRPSLEGMATLRTAVSSKEMSLEKMQQKGLPITIKQNPAFDAFIQRSGIFQAVNYYNHGWVRDKSGIPQLLVDDQYMAAEEVLKRFELKEIKLGPKMIYAIFDKTTGQRWSYLQNGLTLHDPTKSFIPVKKVEGDGTYSISFVATDHGDTTSDVGIKRILSSHAWIRMQDQEGNVYSAGKWGNGLIASPDYTEYESVHTLSAKVTLTADQFAEIKREIERQQAGADGEFSILRDNCSEFSAGIARMLFPEISAEASLDVLDTVVNRLKYYYGAVEMAKGLFANKEKVKKVLEKVETGQSALKVVEPGFIFANPLSFAGSKEKLSSEARQGSGLAFPSFEVDPKKYLDLPGVQRLYTQMDQVVKKAPEIAPAALTATAESVGFQVPAEDMIDFGMGTITQSQMLAQRAYDIREKISKIEPTKMAVNHFLGLAGLDRDDLRSSADEAIRTIKTEAFQDFKRVLNALPDSNEKAMILLILQALEENIDPKMMQIVNDKIKAILRAVNVYLDTNNEAALIDSIFNLCLNLAKAVHGFTLNHPYTLFESLSKKKKVQVEKFRA